MIFKNIYFWLCCIFVASQAFSSCSEWGLLSNYGVSASHCGGGFCCRAQALGGVNFSSCGAECRLSSCNSQTQLHVAQGIFLDQGSNQCLLHCKADSYPLDHQGNPYLYVYVCVCVCVCVFKSPHSSLCMTSILCSTKVILFWALTIELQFTRGRQPMQ